MNPARQKAVQSLIAIEKNRRYSNLELDASLTKSDLSDADRRLYAALLYGVVERKITLDYDVTRFSGRNLSKIDPELLAILRISLYQLFFMDKIPRHAILHEAAELAKLRYQTRGANFVSGVLHRALQAIDQGEDRTAGLDPLTAKSVKTALPVWMLSLWESAYGSDRANQLTGAFNTPVFPTVFVNLQKCNVENLARLFAENGLKTRRVSDTLPLLQFTRFSGEIRKLPGFAEGFWFIQDRASAAAVSSLGVRPGDTVADLCAAPGGKSFAAAIFASDQAQISASDLHENKLSLIRSGAARLGIQSIRVSRRDAREVPENLVGAFDKVICDVPCSGLGVLAKKPDLRHKDPADLDRLPQIQYEILCAASRLLKPQGHLLYSTCTLNPRENEEILSRFLCEHPGFAIAVSPQTLFPEPGVSDGFFYGVLTRL